MDGWGWGLLTLPNKDSRPLCFPRPLFLSPRTGSLRQASPESLRSEKGMQALPGGPLTRIVEHHGPSKACTPGTSHNTRPHVDHQFCRLAGMRFGNPSVALAAGCPAPWSSDSHRRSCLLAPSITGAYPEPQSRHRSRDGALWLSRHKGGTISIRGKHLLSILR